jgi:hypothetical protein
MSFTRVLGPGIHTASNINSHNIKSTGIITAVSFVGDGSSLTGIANTDFIVGTAITMGTANFTGALTGTTANFSGNVTVGGVLTYEDVKNVDSVGLITARDGIKVGTGVTFETNGQGTFSGIVTSRGYEVSYADAAVTHNYFKAGRIRIWDNGSHCQIHFGTHPSYSQHQRYSSVEVVRTNAWYLQNTAATRYGITWVNSDGPVNLWYTKGYAPDYSIKLSTTPIGVTVGSGVTIETNGQATFSGIVTATAFKLADGSAIGAGAGGTWSTYTAGIATSKSVGVNTSNLDDTDLTGIGNSFKGLYISNGMIVHDNNLNGNHYIGTSMNGLMAGPVTIEGNLEIDGNYVVV